MDIKAKDLIKQQKKKQKEKDLIYKKIYQRIEKKIVMASKLDFSQCLYEIPEFMLGVPLYNLNQCISYNDKKLKENGFKTIWNRNTVLVNWEEN